MNVGQHSGADRLREIMMADFSIGNREKGENRLLTEAWVVLFSIGTSLLSASAAGRGASSSEFAPAFFPGRAPEELGAA